MKMKLKLKQIVTSILAGVMLLFSCVFVGCGEKEGPIPDGCYQSMGNNTPYICIYKFTENRNDILNTEGWEIEGDTAQNWVSGYVARKARIVERDDRIYFECYQWRSFWDILFNNDIKSGTTEICCVIYDEMEKSITVTWGKNGE